MRALVPLAAIVLGAAAILGLEGLFAGGMAQVMFLVVVLATVMVVGILLRPDRRMPLVCDPFVLGCAFLGQFYLAGPIIMSRWGLSPTMFFRAPDMDAAVWPLIGCLGLVTCAILGYRLDLGRLLADRLPVFPATARKMPRGWVVAGTTGLGVLGCLWWIDYQGGLMAKLGIAYGGGKSGAAFALAFNLLLVGTILWGWSLMDARDPRPRARYFFYGALLMEALFFGVIYGVRKYLFFLFFGLLTCWALRRGVRTLPKLTTAAMLIVLLVFFSVWGAVRSTSVASMLGIAESGPVVQESSFEYGYLSGVADPFGTATLIWQIFPEQEAFRHGGTLLVTVLGFIPRAVWPDKPVGLGKDITRYYVGPFYQPTEGFSVTVTLPADLYVNFGWPGLAFGGLLLGILFRVVVAYAVAGMEGGVQKRAARVLVPTIFVMGLGEVRADMAQMLAFYIMTGVPLLAGLLLFRLDGEAAAARPRTPEPQGALVAQEG